MLVSYAAWVFWRCSSVSPKENVLRRHDMAAVGKVLLPVICRPRDVRRYQIGLYMVEEGGLKMLRRCVLPEFPILKVYRKTVHQRWG